MEYKQFDYLVEDPSKVPPEEKYPVMTKVDVDLIRNMIREDNKNNPQIDGIWFQKKQGASPLNITYWRLEDEDGYCMIFNSASVDYDTIEKCIQKFKINKE